MWLESYWLWGLLLVALVVIGGSGWWFLGRPISDGEARAALTQRVEAIRNKSPQLAQAQMLVASPQFSGQFGASPEQPFHVASMGKLFTTVLIAHLVEEGRLRWDSRLVDLLPAETLKNLFAVDGVDYRDQVTLEQLLAHTSGIADYLADPVEGGEPLTEQAVLEPQKAWTPQELLAVTRDRQRARFAPRGGFHYSDTGFVLLGLVLEAHYGQRFEDVAHGRIFGPLGMEHSYFPFRTRPARPTGKLSPVWVNGSDLSGSPALTVDWAGGGAASTAADLLKFAQALMGGKLVRSETLAHLSQPLNRFERVIRYGRGLMRLRFADFFPPLSGYPDMIGHMGVLGTQLFLEPESQTVVIVSLGATGRMETSVRLIIETVGTLRRIRAHAASSRPSEKPS